MRLMTNNKFTAAALVIGILALLVGGYWVFHGGSAIVGAASSNNQTGDVVPNKQWFSNGFGVGNVQQFFVTAAGVMGMGASATQSGYQQTATVGTCNTASSTAFDIANPFAATSTATVERIDFGVQATSTTASVGTTTKSSGLASSDVSTALVSSALVATGTAPIVISGQSTGLGLNQISAGAGTVAKIVVGPSQRLAMYATSTYSNAGAINYTPSSCTYKVRWGN